LDTLAINLLLGIMLSTIVAWYYVNHGRTLSNRGRFAQTLPVLTLTTILIISVVKSSLALSLGLVGALSIVRFRTAIKEPEELVFLFMAIAIGLGLGADQRLPTILAILVITGFQFTRKILTSKPTRNNLYFSIGTSDQETTFGMINDLLLSHVQEVELRRLDGSATNLQATYLISCPDDKTLVLLMDNLRATLPDSEFSFVEQDNSLGG
jgi:hypothetical protein